MAYEETASEKAKRQAKEAKWKADAKDKEEKKDYEIFGSRGDAARKGMEEGKTNPMGDTYKKGGKIMSKKSKRYNDGGFATEEGENKNIDDDVRARAMAALEKGISDDTAAPAKKAPAKSFASKAKDAGFTSAETKGGAALMTRKDRSTSTAATPKRAVRKSSASDIDYSVGNAMKKGGSVGSASRRADGCAIKGKTRGRMV